MKKIIVFILVLLINLLHLFAQQNHTRNLCTLHIRIENPAHPDKPVYIALYDSEAGFNEKKAVRRVICIPAKSPEAVLEKLPPGKYALLCFQDLNGNKMLDFDNYIPVEPWGISNNSMLMRPPVWTDAVFELKGTVELTIKLF